MSTLRPDARVLIATLSSAPIALLAIADPDLDSGEAVYGAEDWRDLVSPSFDFDSDGDLRRHNGERCYGPALACREGTLDDLAAWPCTSGIFVD